MATTSVLERNEEGTYIPASQRPDGTWRKPRRVKEGYVPQEEVPLYESRGKQWAKSHSTYPVGLDPELIKSSEQKSASKANAAATKKKKKGSANQPVPNPGAFDDSNQINQQLAAEKLIQQKHQTFSVVGGNKTKTNSGKKQQDSSSTSASSTVQSKKDVILSSNGGGGGGKNITAAIINEQQSIPSTEPTKRLRNLRKKLRDIENLEQKIKSKELKNPDKDQIEKVSRKESVQAEILALELELSMKINST